MDTLHGRHEAGTAGPAPDVREQARQRLQERRDFTSHLAAYVAVNASLVVVWALTGGYFWPAWLLGVWGAGLALHAWETFLHRPITDADVGDELKRRR